MQTIIFDFGNVVGFFDHWRTIDRILPHARLADREAMFASVYNGGLEDRFERGLVSVPDFLAQVTELWQLGCESELLVQAYSDIFTPNPEVCDLIPKLAERYRLVLGSNTNAIHSGRFIAQFADVLCHFDSLVLSHEVGTRKPDIDFFRHCAREAGAAPAKCVFVDDLQANVAGARSLGFHGLVYRPGESLADQLRGLGVTI